MPVVNAFHGTPYRFAEFVCPPSGLHFGTIDQAAHAATIKLGKMPVDELAILPIDHHGWRGLVIPVRLTIHRLKRVRDARTAKAWAKQIAVARAEGFDGLVYRNHYEGRDGADSYCVFDARQVERMA